MLQNLKLRYCAMALLSFVSVESSAQIKATTECYPFVTKSVCGVTSFDREKYVNIAGDSNQAKAKFNKEQNDYLFKELEIKFGRGLGMVKSEYKYTKSLREDSERVGYTDLTYFQQRVKRQTSGLEYYKSIFGDNEGMAIHDGKDTYPDYMAKYSREEDSKAHDKFPENTDAAGELVANILKYKYDNFTRPQYYEIVNEPHWSYMRDDRFFALHTDVKRHVDQLGLDVLVGGPCLSVSNFYGNHYRSTNSMHTFFDKTNFGLDFYSFHTYDYITWDRDKKEWVGEINSGAPLEGVIDALASYTYNKYGREFKYVATEHGGYVQGKSYGKTVDDARKEAFDYYANTYFPGSGFEFEMERRSVDNFLMVSSAIANTFVFMNQPHIVLKSVPFILLDTSQWDPYYYATLYVRDDFDKQSPTFSLSPLIYFYEFFKGVKGEYLHSWSDSGDIQHVAYRDGDRVILLYNNVSNEIGEVSVKLNGYKSGVKGAEIRRVGRYGDSRKPYLTQEKLKDVSSFKIAPRESVAIFLPNVGGETKQLNERAHYATEQSVQFTGSHTFSLNVDNASQIEESFLRVGINRKSGVVDGVTIRLNGEELVSRTEHSCDRYIGKQGYTTTRIIHLPKGAIKAQNSVEISFADGGDGGVGAVVLRSLSSKP